MVPISWHEPWFGNWKLSSCCSSTLTYRPQLVSDFTLPGKGSAGEHICLVTQVLGGDVKSLFSTHGQPFPLPLAKCILLHVLRGIAHAHKCGVVHADLKHDNIFFSTPRTLTPLASDLPHRYPPEAFHDGMVHAAVSQPLPLLTTEQVVKRGFVVGDFGSVEFKNITCVCFSMLTNCHSTVDHRSIKITAYPLRPPEILISGPWNEKVVI